MSADRRPLREVVIGRHSSVWREVSGNPDVARRFAVAIGHTEVTGFRFTPADRVWVFAYSHVPVENVHLLEVLEQARVREVVYVSTAAAIVTRVTRCYRYPRVKQQAEDDARRRLDARILTLGLVYRRLEELPAGRNIATSLERLAGFLMSPEWPEDGGARKLLFEAVDNPFPTTLEAVVYRAYATVQWQVRRWPCLLRPVDLVLSALRFRWYGYVCLSNRLWISTTS